MILWVTSRKFQATDTEVQNEDTHPTSVTREQRTKASVLSLRRSKVPCTDAGCKRASPLWRFTMLLWVSASECCILFIRVVIDFRLFLWSLCSAGGRHHRYPRWASGCWGAHIHTACVRASLILPSLGSSLSIRVLLLLYRWASKSSFLLVKTGTSTYMYPLLYLYCALLFRMLMMHWLVCVVKKGQETYVLRKVHVVSSAWNYVVSRDVVFNTSAATKRDSWCVYFWLGIKIRLGWRQKQTRRHSAVG